MLILAAAFCSSVIALIAYWRRSLSLSGALGALGVGTLVGGLGGWQWALLLVFFFVTSSYWSHYKKHEKKAAAGLAAKGNQRDLWQVLANGGLAALAALGNGLWPEPLWWGFFIGAMAAATADTWATELGTLASRSPRLLTTGKKVAPGTSGGVSWPGTLAALGGGMAIGLGAGVLVQERMIGFGLLGATAGLIGALIDSLLGATLQRVNRCYHCGATVEGTVHCGQPTQPWRGWRWMDNDAVNLFGTLAGAGVGGLGLLRVF